MEKDKLSLFANLFNEDKLEQAQETLEELYLECPSDHEVLHIFGVLKLKLGQLTEGINLIKQAIEIKPDLLQPYFNLSIAYFNNKNYQEAIEINLKAIEINKNAFTAYQNLGHAYKEIDDIDQAIKISLEGLKINPFNEVLLSNIGYYYFLKNSIDEAIACYLKLAVVNPDYPLLYFNLGICYNVKNDKDNAKNYFEKDLIIRPNSVETFNKLCNIYLAEGDQAKVEQLSREFISRNPYLPDGYFALGTSLMDSNPDLSMDQFEKAIDIDKNFYRAYCNIGMLYSNRNNPEKTIYYFQKAVEIAPDFPEAETNLAYAYLSNKDFEKAWQPHEARFYTENFKKNNFKFPATEKPFWNGEDLSNKTIYVYYEQGLGDTIHFSRYFNLLKETNAKILFKCQPHLITFLEYNYPYLTYLNYDIDESKLEYDYHIALMSLPKVFNTNVNNIPSPNKYMNANPAIVKAYKDQIFNNKKFKVGICWRGGPMNMTDKARSIALKYFYVLNKIPNLKLYSLQKHTGLQELNNLPPGQIIENLGQTFKDFSYTAAGIENLDLVISVDTSVAHVAGAIGKPVWLLLLYNSDWRWFYEGETTPWYSGHRLFRQSKSRDWNEVFENVYKNLAQLVNTSGTL